MNDGARQTFFAGGKPFTIIDFIRSGAQIYEYGDSNNHLYCGGVIDTGIVPTYNTKIYLKFRKNPNTTKNWAVFIGEQSGDDTSNTVQIRNNGAASSSYVRFFNVQPNPVSLNYNNIVECELASTYYIYNGTRYTLSNVSSSYTGHTTLYLGCVHNTSSGSGPYKIWRPADIMVYSLKIWESDMLVRDYVPIYHHKEKRYGLYDNVNKTFSFSISDFEWTNNGF